MISPAFWRGRRVFVTGHTGFKGSWLVLWLHALGAEVTGYALDPPSTPDLYTLAGVAERCESLHGDVQDARALEEALRRADPEVVFHLAAQALVRDSYADPVGTYATNVMGTVHVLDAMRRQDSVRAAVIVTSDKCYENREWVWGYRENEAMGGHDPYSSSKGCAELVTSAYRRSYFAGGGPAVATARAGNVIGGGDWAADRLVPDIFRALVAGRPVRLRNPRATRPWQHVLEPLCGYLALAERLTSDGAAFADGWNFGPGEDDVRSVEDVTTALCALWGRGARWELDEGAHPHEAMALTLNCARARRDLGWRPVLLLDDALAWIVEWMRAWDAGGNAAEKCLVAIARYTERLEQATARDAAGALA